MDTLPVDVCLSAVLLWVWCVPVQPELSCDQTEFLHPNDTCVACPVCLPGEQLSEDCGFGDGGDGVCVQCEEGRFSTEAGVAPCRRCTQCGVLNRRVERVCSPASDALCGRCLPRYYELRSMTGEAELLCVPCYSHDTVHKECLTSTPDDAVTLPLGSFREPEERRAKAETFPAALIGSATASLIFLVALLLWLFLLTAERFKQSAGSCPEPGGQAADLQCSPLLSNADRAETASEAPSQAVSAEGPARGQNSLSTENEVHSPSIVINVTTNIKHPSQHDDIKIQEEEQRSNTEEMEKNLQDIWELAQGQSIETLDYDSVQDLSLLLDSAGSHILRRLGQSLGVPPQVAAHLRGFLDLFHYLRTSTYTLLPQLAQAAALLPNAEVVARIHRAVVNK